MFSFRYVLLAAAALTVTMVRAEQQLNGTSFNCAVACAESALKESKQCSAVNDYKCVCENSKWQTSYKKCYEAKNCRKYDESIFKFGCKDCANHGAYLSGISVNSEQCGCTSTLRKAGTCGCPKGHKCQNCPKGEECVCPKGQTCGCKSGYKCTGF